MLTRPGHSRLLSRIIKKTKLVVNSDTTGTEGYQQVPTIGDDDDDDDDDDGLLLSL
eukprot:SAG31_NODE_10819_length_1093_cov_1.485915_1_plen_56_part_00